jgi:hypothetical protein
LGPAFVNINKCGTQIVRESQWEKPEGKFFFMNFSMEHIFSDLFLLKTPGTGISGP